MDLDPGQLVAQRFRIIKPIGRGGMGEVFAAENLRTGRQVAIKLLRSESKQKSSAIERFRREARAAGSIQSDFVTQILDVDEDPEHGIVLVFELLEGESLVDRLKRTGPIPFDELHPLIEQIWMGLADAHRAGIIHRDLKPSNVFLERRPNGGVRVKLLDFGISKIPKEMGGETLTELGQSLGTFSFMPPEQIGKAKTVDHRADIYACASLIYQALSGQLPYAAKNILMMVELKTKQEPRRLSAAMEGTVDPRLDDFLAVSLARDPDHRFQSADEALATWRSLAGTASGQVNRSGSSGGQAPGGQAPGGQAPGGQAPGGQAPGGQSPRGQAPGGQAPRGRVSMHGGERPQTPPGFAPAERPQSSGNHSGSQSRGFPAMSAPMNRGPVSVPRVNTQSDSWDDSVPSSEGGQHEDAATVAIRRDQVGRAIQQYARASTPAPNVPQIQSEEDVRTTNQGTVMMMKSPLGVGQSMHRPRSSGMGGQGGGGQGGGGQGGGGQGGSGHPTSNHGASGHGGGGMMAPALMPPLAPPPQQGGLLSQASGDSSGGRPVARKSSVAFVVGAILLALTSFAIIAVLLELVGKR